VLVTDRGRVVAQLIPAAEGGSIHASRYDALVAAGVIRPARGPGGDPLRDLPSLRLPRGTASRWIDEVRGER